MKKLIAGNWKMNGGARDGTTLAREIAERLNASLKSKTDILVCPPFINMEGVQFECEEADIAVGAQDCSDQENGAYTGQISASMIAEAGCTHVILGHSERRQYQNETNPLISRKAVKAHEHDLVTIICVGELEAERDAGRQENVVETQLAEAIPDCATAENTVIAYEPVWAIGTGKTASADDIRAMHAFIRAQLQKRFSDGGKFRILYGGSVKPSNAAEIFAVPNVNGALVGGASLKADDFLEIIRAA
ncbi:MAG: triose-phosphate isomerase [Rhodospirillales bacterium]|nr:triose-phosphate isomerase [Rhodospirillales bacterium]MCB9980718.1 triose-phosphate isomerase [Rhodospirillales bacterium]